jgi:hypothetical protein
MNLCFYFSFLSSFYTYEDGSGSRGGCDGLGAPGADRGGSSWILCKWSYIFVL